MYSVPLVNGQQYILARFWDIPCDDTNFLCSFIRSSIPEGGIQCAMIIFDMTDWRSFNDALEKSPLIPLFQLIGSFSGGSPSCATNSAHPLSSF